ncbi:O-methyltransferase family protein [Cordyceps militaris CM01]|uniref:O-methyltransferase family protein n=1 Tax=Cordyceps militaris (strain CM01) TaxID=983644 RepID=G3JT86_CORMM|nr:O-methyltransferase family protein [Cordyceps militaris CM01]EGX88233.1 O-methyltransferase family protein [Cordyceps militaris CM01]
MKEESPVLYQNPGMGERIGSYAKMHSTSVPQNIIDYHEHIREKMPATANYMVSISQAQAMHFLAKTVGAKRILEVGVYVGLSSLVWSNVVGENGKVTGLEFDPAFAKQAEETFAKYGVENVEILVGDALEVLPTLAPDEPYDIIFIDAQKSGYPQYLDTILKLSQPGSSKRLLRAGGLIIGDNVLRCGFVADDSEGNPWREYDFGPHRKEYWKSEDIQSLRKYNDAVSGSERLESWLCPLWDGVNLARLLD